MGIRRLIRINDVTICLADGVNNAAPHEGMYRSTDNGMHWTLIGDKDYSNRGTIITGPGEMVYVFWISTSVDPGIYMTKFHYQSSPPQPTRIYQGYVTSVASGGGYQYLSGAVGENGTIYLTCNYAPSDGAVDRIWFLKSSDGGNNWTTPDAIAYESGTSFTYPSLEVNNAGNLILCFSQPAAVYLGGKEDSDKRIYFMRSNDGGEVWSSRIQVDSPEGPFRVYNPSILEDQHNSLYIFAQRAFAGLVMAKSTNGGTTWSGFTSIIPTSDYADASAAVGTNGTLYITYRDDLLCGVTEPRSWRNCLAQSTDGGTTWTLVDIYCGQNRTGPGNSLRYANWWNYGGPLEWCWQQYLNSDTSLRPVYYDINTSVSIWNRTDPIQPYRKEIDQQSRDHKLNPTDENKNRVLDSINIYMDSE